MFTFFNNRLFIISNTFLRHDVWTKAREKQHMSLWDEPAFWVLKKEKKKITQSARSAQSARSTVCSLQFAWSAF